MSTGDQDTEPHDQLSNREFEVMTQMLSGRHLKQIAGELSLSYPTVSTFRSRVFKKLHVSSDIELARYAMSHNLFR